MNKILTLITVATLAVTPLTATAEIKVEQFWKSSAETMRALISGVELTRDKYTGWPVQKIQCVVYNKDRGMLTSYTFHAESNPFEVPIRVPRHLMPSVHSVGCWAIE